MSITQPAIIQAVDRSILQTIEAFVRFRPGFHGDTGIRDYLYHRLMTNLPNGGAYERTAGGGTLLAQAEWYTALKYRRTGGESSPGRFDIGIPNPAELDIHKPHPLVAFECGRNKRASSLLFDIDAIAEHEGPEPGDITKLAREIRHRDLPFGYALEFFDKGMCGEAEDLIGRLQPRISSESDRLQGNAIKVDAESRARRAAWQPARTPSRPSPASSLSALARSAWPSRPSRRRWRHLSTRRCHRWPVHRSAWR